MSERFLQSISGIVCRAASPFHSGGSLRWRAGYKTFVRKMVIERFHAGPGADSIESQGRHLVAQSAFA